MYAIRAYLTFHECGDWCQTCRKRLAEKGTDPLSSAQNYPSCRKGEVVHFAYCDGVESLDD